MFLIFDIICSHIEVLHLVLKDYFQEESRTNDMVSTVSFAAGWENFQCNQKFC